jgi:hypothetical protein
MAARRPGVLTRRPTWKRRIEDPSVRVLQRARERDGLSSHARALAEQHHVRDLDGLCRHSHRGDCRRSGDTGAVAGSRTAAARPSSRRTTVCGPRRSRPGRGRSAAGARRVRRPPGPGDRPRDDLAVRPLWPRRALGRAPATGF